MNVSAFCNKTTLSLLVTVIAGALSAFGHSLSPDQTSQLSDALTSFATGVSLIMPVLAAIFHVRHIAALTNSTQPTSQKAG